MNMDQLTQQLYEVLKHITGYIYPNEIELHWGILIVVYPYITGLVAGAFILASLERVFNVKELAPTYRLSLLTALAFLITAPLPLLAHLGHIERSYEIFLTPQLSSAMAVFGFVYAWYLMVVLLLEIWFDYRKDIVLWAQKEKGTMRLLHRIISLFSHDISGEAVKFDQKAVKYITIVGIPSAFLLHGYVGFIFGSVKANPWWSSVLIPVVFLFSAIVSGLAIVLLVYMIAATSRAGKPDMRCLDRLSDFLLYAIIVDFSLEMLDFIHRIYESEESIKILFQMVSSRLFISLIVVQVLLGTIVPMVSLAGTLIFRARMPEGLRRLVYFLSCILVQIGIFSTRWNVVIGGQLFSKSFRGLTIYKMELLGIEGLLTSIGFLVLPFVILYILVKILPPWRGETGIDTLMGR